MKPGMILTNYKFIEPEEEIVLSKNNYNLDELTKLKEEAKKEADEIILAAKKEAILEKETILREANLLLNESIELKNNIEKDYIENLKKMYYLDIDEFIYKKNNDFSKIIETISDRFDIVFESAKENSHNILLKSFETLFKKLYDEPEYIKELIIKNFVGFEDSKNVELQISQDAFDKFNKDTKYELETELDIVLDSIKPHKDLNGVILKTNKGCIEIDLDNQIKTLKSNIENCTTISK